jgi:hypothetical protein
MKTLARLTLGLVLVTGCGTDGVTEPDGPEILPALTVPPAPENGIQIITAPFRDIAPGKDYEVCTWTSAIFDRETDVKSTLGYQTEPPGHHVILFYTMDTLPAGTQRVCTDTDMASFRYLTGNGTNGIVNTAPGDLVFRIPAGAQLVMNQHFLNVTEETVSGQSALNVNFAEPGSVNTPSSSLAAVNTGLIVEQGVTTQKMKCTYDRPYKLWYLIPHMHRWGQKISVDLTRNGDKHRYFDTTWAEEFTFHPPEMRMDPSAPLTINPGDQLDVECTWNNDEGRVLPFGFEMCVVFAQFVDDQGIGSWACDNGQWTVF